MNAYKVELLIIDHDNIGVDDMREVIENTRYPNRCISPHVMQVTVRDIGEWTDEHPLNHNDTQEEFYKNIFE